MKTQTLKFRLTLYYVLGFLVSLLLCFTVIYGVQRHAANKTVLQKLTFFGREFQYEYLAGHEFRSANTFLEMRHITPPCQQALQRALPGFRALSVTMNPERHIEILGVRDGGILKVILAPDRAEIQSVTPMTVEDRPAYMEYEFNEEAYGENQNQFFFLLFSPDGKLLTRSPFHERFVPQFTSHILERETVDAPPSARRRHGQIGHIETLRNQGVRIRALHHTLFDGNVLFIGANLTDYDKNLNRLLLIFLCSLIGMISVALAIGYLLASNVSNGINRLAAAAREIESGNYGRRVQRGPEGLEINALIDAFNDMTGKTEKLLTELKTISENIAHDLRTPLTRMRGKAEVSLFSGTDTELASVIAEECADMLEMINTMLEITQTEYRFDTVRATRVDLRELILRSLDLFSTIAEDRQITLASHLPDDETAISGHASKLQRMVANLLDNALKFTPHGGTVTVTLAQTADCITLTIADTGCGIPTVDQPHIFERFYRSSTSRTLPGNGLGLSLARAIVHAHAGRIHVQSALGHGTTFILTFPRA